MNVAGVRPRMSAPDPLVPWLARAVARLRLNASLVALSRIACGLCATAALYQALRIALLPVVLTALLPLLLLAAAAVSMLFASRLVRRPHLAQAAAAADVRAGL